MTRGTPSGFTLIELLVVISVIALLLALLVRALRGARNQARKVMCRSNLRQFGSTLLMYVEDNEGRLPCGRAGALWLLRGSPPGEQQDPYAPEVSQSVRMARAACCPMAIKAATNTGAFHTRFTSNGNRIWEVHGTGGTTFRAWTIASPGPTFQASYGFNFWPFRSIRSQLDSGFFSGSSVRGGLNVFTVASRSTVPILLDSFHIGTQPRNATKPPTYESRLFPEVTNPEMNFCINRHNGRVNSLFLDWSVREVGLKELWTLKWCPNFDTAGPWTLAGGVQPEGWPEWMRGFKDY